MIVNNNVVARTKFPVFRKTDMPDQTTPLTNASKHSQSAHINEERGSIPNAQPKPQIEDLLRKSASLVGNHLTAVEFEHLHARVIALENVLIGLLAGTSDDQITLVRAMAVQMFPQPGFTQHCSTQIAANQIEQLIERANHFREVRDA